MCWTPLLNKSPFTHIYGWQRSPIIVAHPIFSLYNIMYFDGRVPFLERGTKKHRRKEAPSRKKDFSSQASRGTQRKGCNLMIQAPTQLPLGSRCTRRTGCRSGCTKCTNGHLERKVALTRIRNSHRCTNVHSKRTWWTNLDLGYFKVWRCIEKVKRGLPDSVNVSSLRRHIYRDSRSSHQSPKIMTISLT